jgi:hypothetical protein
MEKAQVKSIFRTILTRKRGHHGAQNAYQRDERASAGRYHE